MLNVSRSGFYAWRNRGEATRDREERVLAVHIKSIHRESRETYGSPRMHRELLARGIAVGRHRVARIMRRHRIRPKQKRKFRVTTKANGSHRASENLLERQFHQKELNRVWVSDITYLETREGWLYLCVIIDLCSRRVVGWAASRTMDVNLTIRVLTMATQTRHVLPGLIFHSDRGSQYSARAFRRLLRRHGMRQSMSRKGDCWDNAVAESFFATLKTELGRSFDSRQDALRQLHQYIHQFYNRSRRHSTLGGISPLSFEQLMVNQVKVA